MKVATTISMVLSAVVGIFWTGLYWKGLVAWCHFCSLPYEQIKGTPQEGMWTSLRGATGVLILMMVLVQAMTMWRCKRDQGKGQTVRHPQATTQ